MIGDGIMDKDIYIYTGWWFHPSENMSSLVGMMKFPTEWKNKNMFQTTNQYIYIHIYIYIYQQHHEGSGWLANPSTTYEYMTWIWGHPKYFLTGQRIYTQLESGALIKEYQSYPTQQSNFDMGKTQGKPTHQLCKKMIDHQEVRRLDLQKDQRWETWLIGLQTPKAAGWISGILWVYIMILGTSVYDTVDGPAKS